MNPDAPSGSIDPRSDPAPSFVGLPLASTAAGADLAVLGLAFDPAGADGASGAPHAVRVASSALTPSYNPSQRLEVLPALGAVDLGDVIPIGELDRALESLSDAVAAVVREGAVALCLGGHPAVTLAALRAVAARHGPVALVAFDAHLDEGRGIRGAVDQGLVDPARSTLLGPRGGTAGPGAFDELRELGLLVFGWDELAQLGSGAVAAAVDRAAGPAVLAVDLDVADPAFAPAVARPVAGGPTSAQVVALIRACRGLDLAAAIVGGFVPARDGSGTSSLLAATVAWEIMALVAAGKGEGP